MKYLVSGYCLVPMKAEVEVDAETPEQAVKVAKAKWKQDRRSLIVPGGDAESSACDWHRRQSRKLTEQQGKQMNIGDLIVYQTDLASWSIDRVVDSALVR